MFKLRVFVESHDGAKWLAPNLPRIVGVREDEGPNNELQPPTEAFSRLLRSNNGPDYLEGLPDDFLGQDYFEPPYTADPGWTLLDDILGFPWTTAYAVEASPLLNRDDLNLTAESVCSHDLVSLNYLKVKVPGRIRLVFWDEEF